MPELWGSARHRCLRELSCQLDSARTMARAVDGAAPGPAPVKYPQPLAGTSISCALTFLDVLLEHCFEFFFERSRRNSEKAKSGPAVRGRRVDLHKLNLIARERRVRQHLGEAGGSVPENKGHPHQHRPQSCDTRNGPQQLLV